MKTIFTLLTSLLVSMSVLASGDKPKSTLTIESSGRGGVKVVIDGRSFQSRDNYFRIDAMDFGKHDVQVYRERINPFFGAFGVRYEMVFNDRILMRPFSDITISIDRFGRTTVNEDRHPGRFSKDDDRDFDNDRDDHQGNYDKSFDGTGYNDYGYGRAMNDVEFDRVLDCIQKEWYENNKVKSASQIISTNYFTSFQVKQMLQLFSFETNKLELAKQAYTKTIDKQNYNCVFDVFTFGGSREELARYIRSCR